MLSMQIENSRKEVGMRSADVTRNARKKRSAIGWDMRNGRPFGATGVSASKGGEAELRKGWLPNFGRSLALGR
jgi:hypothetical protein